MDADTGENGCKSCALSQTLVHKSDTSKNSRNEDTEQRIMGACSHPNQWLLHICPTTGGELELAVPSNFTVEGLKHVISKKLKLPMDRINLLYRERLLKSGPLIQHGVVDGCKFTLLPNVESGLSTQKTDHSIMQVLETLSDKQVNEFLSGKSPLTIAMRLGEHMMFVQLQLSSSPFSTNRHPQPQHQHHHNQHTHDRTITTSRQHAGHQHPIPYYHSHHHHHHHHMDITGHHQSKNIDPSNLCHQCNTSKTGIAHHGKCKYNASSHFNKQYTNKQRHDPQHCSIETKQQDCSSRISRETNLSNILSERVGSPEQLRPRKFKSPPRPSRILDSPIDSPMTPSGYSSCSSLSDCSSPSSPELTPIMSSTASSSSKTRQRKGNPTRLFQPPVFDDTTKTLQQKLHELRRISKTGTSPHCSAASNSSKLSNKENCTNNSDKSKPAPGAVIDSMRHVGKGVYSGTFSGTLNPALNDGEGKPKRSLSTIVHILNDLLGAAPQGKIQIESISSGIGRGQHAWGGEVNRRGHEGSPQSMVQNKSLDEYKRLEKENQVMKDKVEQVQMMLQQRRQRRRAKREARSSPYGWQPQNEGAKRLKMEAAASETLQEVNMDTSCPPEEVNNTSEKKEESSAFPSELKPEAVLV